jgi:macrodomain Ter protein organizer (MatP/YcbG family)
MTDSDDPEDGGGTTHTSVEIDAEVWRRVRSRAVREDKRVSEMLEEILREHFDMDESNDE